MAPVNYALQGRHLHLMDLHARFVGLTKLWLEEYVPVSRVMHLIQLECALLVLHFKMVSL